MDKKLRVFYLRLQLVWESCHQNKPSISLLAFSDHRSVAHPQRTHTAGRPPNVGPYRYPLGYPEPEASILNTSSNASFPAATLHPESFYQGLLWLILVVSPWSTALLTSCQPVSSLDSCPNDTPAKELSVTKVLGLFIQYFNT